MKRRTLGIAFGALVLGGAGVLAWLFWANRELDEDDWQKAIVGSWVAADEESNVRRMMFWPTGDFQLQFRFTGKSEITELSGKWSLKDGQLSLLVDDQEGGLTYKILRLTKRRLVYANKGGEKTVELLREAIPTLELPDEKAAPTFDGLTDKLTRTVVVPTLETKLPSGKSAIWCATLALAWQQLENDVVKGPIAWDGDKELARDLSQAPAVDLLPEHYFVAAGFYENGIDDRIRRELPGRFPQAPLPPPLTKPGEALAYAYLETAIRYQCAFENFPNAMQFRDGQGGTTTVKTFGTTEKENATIRQQIKVLFRKGHDFAVDLSQTTRPYQAVVARMPRKDTLRETLAEVDKRIAEGPAPEFGDNAVLGIPNMNWALDHQFQEIRGKNLHNATLRPQSFFETAQQSIRFKMDRRGVKVSSAVPLGVGWNSGGPVDPDDYRLDRPYLIVLKNRDCRHPFFVMWVDNAELLQAEK